MHLQTGHGITTYRQELERLRQIVSAGFLVARRKSSIRIKGFKRLTELLKESFQLTIGIHEAEGKNSHGSITVAQVGAINEYGWKAKNIPSRAFVRHTHDAKLQENLALLARLEGNVIEGKRSPENALKLLGEVAAKQMVSRINEGIPPANAPST